MPYVEGYGSWPFGEEWLWEAMATSYLPLLDVLDGAPEVTLSLTPVLCDQLEAPGVGDRFLEFLRTVRVATHELDAEGCRASGHPELAAEIERSAQDYVRAGERFEALGGDLLGALGRHQERDALALQLVAGHVDPPFVAYGSSLLVANRGAGRRKPRVRARTRRLIAAATGSARR